MRSPFERLCACACVYVCVCVFVSVLPSAGWRCVLFSAQRAGGRAELSTLVVVGRRRCIYHGADARTSLKHAPLACSQPPPHPPAFPDPSRSCALYRVIELKRCTGNVAVAAMVGGAKARALPPLQVVRVCMRACGRACVAAVCAHAVPVSTPQYRAVPPRTPQYPFPVSTPTYPAVPRSTYRTAEIAVPKRRAHAARHARTHGHVWAGRTRVRARRRRRWPSRTSARSARTHR